mgnify:CR=1 FL=1|tara:strand:+ start:867 stop:1406 length:540 start_codon:yes stop_codon:yes gene_type:complete
MKELKTGLKLYLSSKKIRSRIDKLGKIISNDFSNKNPIFLGIMNGSFMFMSDLMKTISIPCEIDFIKIHSYKGKKSTGEIRYLNDSTLDITDRHVIIVEDIIDTGTTAKYLINMCKEANAKSISIATLLLKSGLKGLNFNINYIGFEITREFVVGYGLDYNQKFRNLDSIYLIEDKNIK